MHDGPVVVFSGGGTGGHLYPALAVADALRLRRPDVRVLFVGSRRGIEGRILTERGEWHALLPVRGLDRSSLVRSLAGVGGSLLSIGRAVRLFAEIRPEVVVVTGGYASAPAGIAAAFKGIPVVLQEQNAIPGLVTKMLSRVAKTIHVAFPEAIDRLPAGRERARVTGNPVRPAATLGRARARERLGVPEGTTVLLVVGGSQGSLALNRALLDAVRAATIDPALRPEGLHVVWATGPAHHGSIVAELDTLDGAAAWVSTRAYIEEMPVALAAADLALARAGATFTAELLVQGLPAALVPLPTAAEDHQTLNAEALVAAGAAVLLPQAELDAQTLWRSLHELVGTPDRLARMSEAALALARPGAADEIAGSIVEMLPPAVEAA
ncbi:MAG: undecaprenyldiphospho-muramoylpentapeptide beta-N-acetylglucosaminyltransferase [Gemmatimonadota bacterium]